MKKGIIIFVVVLLLVGGVLAYILLKDKVVSTITLDINPSVEISLDKNDKVIDVKALNEDANDIINDNFKGKELSDTINILVDNLIEKDYITEEVLVDIIVYSSGNVTNDSVKEKLSASLSEKNVPSNIIVIEEVTEEDIKLSEKYNVSPAKASYIKSIAEENENINEEDLVDKSVSELEETKVSGNYCDSGYTLEGDWCYKEISRKTATSGEVCPRYYEEYQGKCYASTGILEKENTLTCKDAYKLEGTNCVYTETFDATPSKFYCSKGTQKTRLEMGLTSATAGDANDIVCVDLSKATHPVSPCELHDGTEYTKSGGKCYWHKAPIISSGCPGKIKVKGFCWDDASNVLICSGYRDGKQYKSRDEYCEHSIKYITPSVSEYTCPDGLELNGTKCERKMIEKPQNERYCPSGYTKTKDDRCINYDDIANKTDGLVCEGENTKLRNDTCITYEVVEAHHY